MRRLARPDFRPLGLLAVLPLLIPAAATAQDGSQFFFQSSPTAVARLNPELVVGRMMAFDHNGNGRVERSELTERMHAVVTRGDLNADDALDESEIRTLTRTPLIRNTPQITGFANNYSFGDDAGLSSRSHIEGAIEDLRLSNLRQESAVQEVGQFMDVVEQAAVKELLSALEGNLPAPRLAEIRAALEDRSNGQARFVIMPSQKSTSAHFPTSMFLTTSGAQTMTIVALQVEQIEPALSAVERYKARLRLTDAERAELVDRLAGILSEEDRDNFRAAIERRPVVSAGGAFGKVTALKFAQKVVVQ